MGMFDYVDTEQLCSKCGFCIDKFQSKDGPCYMETLEPYQVKRFYAICPECKAWNEFKVDVEVQIIKCEITRIESE